MSKPLLTVWDDLYLEKTGSRYPINGKKDGQLLKNLRQTYTEDDIARFMRVFFGMDDEFFEKTGWSLGCFYSCLPKVIVEANQVKRPVLSKSTARILAMLRDDEEAV